MKLLKAYVHQVVSYHPPADRDELFAEIYDEICEEYADQLVETPTLSEAGFLDMSKQHPIKYATQLASNSSSYLVGPQFYFSFLSALKTGTSITVGLFLILAVIAALASGDPWRAFYQVMLDIPDALLWVAAVILGIFVAMEKGGEKATWLEGWSANDLKMTDDDQSISRAETFFDLSMSSVALLWIFGVIRFPLVYQNGQWTEDWVSLLPEWLWAVAAGMLLFDICFAIFRLTRNLWTPQLRLITAGTHVLWLVLLGFVAAQPQLLIAAGPFIGVTELVPLFNKWLKVALVMVMAIIAWDTASHIWRLLKLNHH